MTRALGMTDAQDAKQGGCEVCVETMDATVLAAAGLTACACLFRYFDECSFQHWSTDSGLWSKENYHEILDAQHLSLYEKSRFFQSPKGKS